jgi:hypothetical protein
VDLFPAESLVGIPFIFQELADGSQRLVREDGKPLQWQRLPDDRLGGPDEPVPSSRIYHRSFPSATDRAKSLARSGKMKQSAIKAGIPFA